MVKESTPEQQRLMQQAGDIIFDLVGVTREFGLFSTLRKMSSVVFSFIIYNCYNLNISWVFIPK